MRRASVAAAVACAAGLLAACGGSATVDNDAPPTSVAPLERGTARVSESASASAESADASSTSASQSAAASTANASAEPVPQDRPAREVTESVAPAAPQQQDQQFLDALAGQGVNVSGVEDQLVAVGQASCNDADSVTVPAIAGQLIEQQRTELDHARLTELLVVQGRGAYCP
ncbi:DUF732 domain-containing protein [Corynebacterium lizhenjunii]|uniref:DUF732 domain-containing protein n=1 Tax=Corynebacterium lizhenjunii TaxID=2709394 RepID=A0A7T0KDX9_9CORY|nr:DUF732 domain-containing protein [Corynebacterium lizhenjunii]QPK79010.1 DUF732 domain-containing protein [Corynebacterium lizhenjunii]